MRTRVTDRDLQRATSWLNDHDLDVAPTPLLAERLAARRQAMTGLFAIGYVVTMLAAVVIRGLAMRWVARAERRLGATLAVRVAHAPRAGWRAIVGGWRLWV